MPYIIKNGKTYGGVNKYSANTTSYVAPENGITKKDTNIQNAINSLDRYVNNLTNDNLLDNPFFTVNQRGLDEYIPAKTGDVNYIYTVDRWNLAGTDTGLCKLNTLDNGVKITVTTAGTIRFHQPVDENIIKGKRVTLSIEIGENTLTGRAIRLNLSNAASPALDTVVIGNIDLKGKSNCLLYTSFNVPETFANKYINVGIYAGGSSADRYCKVGEYIEIKSIKLEYGDRSTLANDNKPNYAEEVVKCQNANLDPNDTYGNNVSLRIGIDGDGNYGYYKGDDTFVPFKIPGGATATIDGVPYEGNTLILQTDSIALNKSISTLPYEFYGGSAVVLNGEIHILGSYDSGNSTKHYKWNGSTWTSVSTLPYDFDYGSAVVYNNEIHILGSSDSSYYKYHYKYNGSTWTSVSTLPYNFYNGSAVVYNNEIHILGGSNSSYYTKHYKYNGSTWIEVSTLPYNFYYGSAVVLNNEIHILGGGTLDAHYKYDGNTWTSVSTLPYSFNGGSAVVYNNEIHILGSSNSYSYTKHYSIEKLRYNILQ